MVTRNGELRKGPGHEEREEGTKHMRCILACEKTREEKRNGKSFVVCRCACIIGAFETGSPLLRGCVEPVYELGPENGTDGSGCC